MKTHESHTVTQKYVHLSLEQRSEIEDGLNNRMTFQAIAGRIGKDPTTIGKEVKSRRFLKTVGSSAHGYGINRCSFYTSCPVKHLCGKMHCSKLCRTCRGHNCNQLCRAFKERQCSRLSQAPYVCNGCQSTGGCRMDRYYYRATQAQLIYKRMLSDTRTGINLTRDELAALDDLVCPLIRQGQSLNHIFATHKAEIGCSRKTLYSYINQGCLSVINLDLPRLVKYKKRRKHRKEAAKDPRYRVGRNYKDYLKFTAVNPGLGVVQADTVEGSDCCEVLLTLFFCNTSLMLICLLPSQTQACVLAAFDSLESQLGSDLFSRLFPVILTDNGSEFKDPDALQRSVNGGKRTRVFYCDPGASWQKGALEKNHGLIRRVLPKGTSFAGLSPEKVFLLRDHINSYRRDSLNGNSPLDLASLLTPTTALEQLDLRRIPPDHIILNPSLLK